MFVAGLSGLAADEVRKAKVLDLRNAISEFQATQASLQGFRSSRAACRSSPFLARDRAQKRIMNAQMQLGKDRIRNAIEVWRSDLKGERFLLDGEEIIA